MLPDDDNRLQKVVDSHLAIIYLIRSFFPIYGKFSFWPSALAPFLKFAYSNPCTKKSIKWGGWFFRDGQRFTKEINIHSGHQNLESHLLNFLTQKD